MLLITAIITGFIRLTLLGLFLFFLNKKIFNYHYPDDILNYVVNRWVRYASVLLILIFILTLINAYDLFTIILFLVLFLSIYFFDIKSVRGFFSDIKNKLTFFLIFILKNRETKGKIFKLNTNIKHKGDKKGKYNIIILGLIIVGVIISRLSFFDNDIYLFSDLWERDLEKVKILTTNTWFAENLTMTGEYALINFYSKLVGVSPEIALQSFGILETVLITIILFWFTSKITKSKTIAPILTAIFFVISPLLLPRSIDIITQHKPIFLALSLALPMMIFTVLPKNLSKYYRKYLIYSIIIFTAIALIDLFTFVILLSPFLVLAFFFYQKKYRQFYYLVVLAYFVSLVFVMSIYGFTGLHYNLGFNSIITSNLLSLNVFTHLPDLILPYDELINIYQYISLFNVVLILFLIKHKKHWLNSFLFILYFNALIFINTLNISWIDEDLLRLSLTIFIPVVIGISIALLFKVIFSFSEKVITNLRIKYNYGVLAIFSIAAVVFYLYKPAIYDTERKDNTDHHAMLVLEAYEKISQDYLPFSYTIVNDYRSYVLSINKHFYMPYSTFKDFYLRRDSIYHTNINDKLFFKQNPESILSKSILVFVHKANNNKTPNLPFYHDNEMEYVAETINILKSRGRKVNIIYENESLSVMEIVNKPNSSKINDLLF